MRVRWARRTMAGGAGATRERGLTTRQSELKWGEEEMVFFWARPVGPK